MNAALAPVDLLALWAEVTAPDYLAKNPEAAAAQAAYDAETARRAAADTAQAGAREKRRTCGRCRGTGHIPEFRHISNGDCFACGGGLLA